MANVPRLSLVVATFNRLALLERLLGQLSRQTLPAGEFEVIVADDGSREPVKPNLEPSRFPFTLRVETQPNSGAAAARHLGILAARAELLVIVDDDMQVGPDFLSEHLAMHPPGTRRAVLGRIRADPQVSSMPLFERWYAFRLDSLADGFTSGRIRLRGGHLYTGNVSLRRSDYFAVGGFDPELKRSEDLELGLRLEEAGVEIAFAPRAYTLHGSDHTSQETWLRRAFAYGIADSRIFKKHPTLTHANPWRFVLRLSPLARPLLGAAAIAPSLTRPLSAAAMEVVHAADRLGLTRVAFAGSAVVYTMEYYRGVREEAGSLLTAAKHFSEFLDSRKGAAGAP